MITIPLKSAVSLPLPRKRDVIQQFRIAESVSERVVISAQDRFLHAVGRIHNVPEVNQRIRKVSTCVLVGLSLPL